MQLILTVVSIDQEEEGAGEVVTQQKHQEAALVPVVCPGEETRKEVVTTGQEAMVTRKEVVTTGQEAMVTTVVVAKERRNAAESLI